MASVLIWNSFSSSLWNQRFRIGLEIINIWQQQLNPYVWGTVLGTSGEIDMNMIWTAFVKNYRTGKVLWERDVQTAMSTELRSLGERVGFWKGMTFELGFKRWGQTSQEKWGEWIFKEERTEYTEAQRHENLTSFVNSEQSHYLLVMEISNETQSLRWER